MSVFATTLDRVDPTATLVREVTLQTVERLKQETDGDVSVGGPTLARAMIELGLVDEFLLYLNPTVVGGGTAYLPPAGRPAPLELKNATVLGSGVARLAYRSVAGS